MFNLAELFCFIGSTVFLFNGERVDEGMRGERERALWVIILHTLVIWEGGSAAVPPVCYTINRPRRRW